MTTEVLFSESKSTIGLRVNPIVGDGDIKELSCASETSKFGIPMTEELKKKITEYYIQHSWLTALHVHIGSQSFDGEQLSKGLKKAVALALKINGKVGRNQVCVFDIGGGYPVNRKDDTITPTFYEYADILRKEIPELFPEYGVFKKVVTEFGQALNAKAGWLASRVEYVKPSGNEELRIALTHVGADLCMRTCYLPQQKKYQRRVRVFNNNGQAKTGTEKRYNIAGPLCFSGDVLKYDALLPEVERGDYLVLLDCGANSLSVLNRHCSRFAPSVFGYRTTKNGEVNFVVLKEAETKDELLKFLGGGKNEDK
ncbi:Diaminopimelate decarboxylase [Paramuricea clavata]|uniref:Diaminopimelate decarboxylase n=1 Tax=Paramuricea clavata TaxID=317549 RepID=A0A7D9IXS5_PARCT|nr:Diaminopimelate decarboxylase [Paramuricea clavata]